MSWSEVVRARPDARVAQVPVTVGLAGRFGLVVSIAADVLPETWRGGMMLSAAIGAGEHAGRLRLTPGGSFSLKRRYGKKGKAGGFRLTVYLGQPDGIGRGKVAPMAVPYEMQPAMLIVTLPPAVRAPLARPVAPPVPPLGSDAALKAKR